MITSAIILLASGLLALLAHVFFGHREQTSHAANRRETDDRFAEIQRKAVKADTKFQDGVEARFASPLDESKTIEQLVRAFATERDSLITVPQNDRPGLWDASDLDQVRKQELRKLNTATSNRRRVHETITLVGIAAGTAVLALVQVSQMTSATPVISHANDWAKPQAMPPMTTTWSSPASTHPVPAPVPGAVPLASPAWPASTNNNNASNSKPRKD